MKHAYTHIFFQWANELNSLEFIITMRSANKITGLPRVKAFHCTEITERRACDLVQNRPISDVQKTLIYRR